jgi:hypothetical protein
MRFPQTNENIAEIHRAHPGIRKFVYFMVGASILIGGLARIATVRPLTNDPLVRAPFMDDGFYYLEITRNVVTRGYFTFDGIHPTNGFHPLWELMLVMIARISIDDFIFLRLVMYFSILWFIVSGLVLYKFVADYGGYFAGLAAVVLWSFSPDLITWQNQGMENTIFLPVLIATLIMTDYYLQHPGSIGRACVLGLLFGVLMWSRSDALLFVILAIAGIFLVAFRKSRSVRAVFTWSTLPIVGVPLLFCVG